MQAVTVGLAAASLPSELSALVFRQSFYRWLLQRVGDLQRNDVAPGLRTLVGSGAAVSQGAVTVWTTDGFGEATGYTVRVGRHGGVAIGYAEPDMGPGATWVTHADVRLAQMLACGRSILDDLGAMGSIHVAWRFAGEAGLIATAQQSDMDSIGEADVARTIRDVIRASGRAEWEPEAE